MGFFDWFKKAKPEKKEEYVPGTPIPVRIAVGVFMYILDRLCEYDYVNHQVLDGIGDASADGLMKIVTEQEFDQMHRTAGQLVSWGKEITDIVGQPERADLAPIGDIGYGTREENIAKTKIILKKYESHYKTKEVENLANALLRHSANLG